MTGELRGFLLIADISGYTGYLSESELEHARGTLTELLELLIDRTRPPLAISGLRGDAVLSYGLEEGFLGGQALVETIENTYVEFRHAIELMVLNNTCRCNACSNVSSLDLKFFVHHGSFAIQRLRDNDELVGSDVNLIHRLMKNSVVAETGITAYTLYTEAACRILGIEDFAGMVRHVETPDDFEPIKVLVQDMHPVFEARRSESEDHLDPEEIFFETESDFALPPEVLWNYLADVRFRSLLMSSDRQEITSTDGGRVAVGSTFQCYHGKQVMPQTILVWRPFERILTHDMMGKPFGSSSFHAQYDLDPIEGGTRLRRTFGRFQGGRLVGAVVRRSRRAFEKNTVAPLREFKEAIEADWEARQTGDDNAPVITPESIAAAARQGLEGLERAAEG